MLKPLLYLNRFDEFKEKWRGADAATRNRQKLCDYFRKKISLKRFYIDENKKSNEKNENRVFFSFYIRTSSFKLMIENYLAKKKKKVESSDPD